MKKLYTTVLAVLAIGATTMTFGQSQRLVLGQHFTQASCGPCASQNPAMEALLASNGNDQKIFVVRHQVSWPGTDPMYNDYPAGPDAMVSYYGVQGVPNSMLDGNVAGPDLPGNVITQGNIDNRYAVASPFDIVITPSLNANWDEVTVNVDVTCTQAVSGNLKLHIVVLEEEIAWQSAPGSNGETNFFNVMRQMLPGTSGTTIASSWAVNDNATVSESWTLQNIYNLGELAALAYIQDDATKEVHQAAWGHVTATSNNGNDAAVLEINDVPASVCGTGDVTPMVTIRNNGNNALTSLDIQYDVNGGTPQTVNWTGNLATLETEQVALPNSTFAVMPNNTLTVTTSNPNGATDENPATDQMSTQIVEAPSTTNILNIELVTDNYGSETSWDVRDGNGTVIGSGNGYGNATTYNEQVNITNVDCYTFNIYDSYGDGICCGYGNGSYTLRDGSNNTLATGGEFSDEENVPFAGGPTAIDPSAELAANISIYPNPFTNFTNLNLTLLDEESVTIDVYNLVGEKVYTLNKGELAAGFHNMTLDFNQFDAGMYIINITAGDKTASKRVTSLK